VNDDPTGSAPVVDRPTSEVGVGARPGSVPRSAARASLHVLVALLLLALTLRTAVTGLSPLLPRVSAGIPLTAAQAGVVGALPPFSFALAGLLGPALLRRVAAERLVLVAMVLEALGLVARPWSGGPWPFVVASVVALLGMGMGNVILPVLVKAWFPDRIPAVTSLYVMGLTAGTSLPALLAVPLADAAAGASGSARLGWQIGLAWGAVLCALVCLAWWWPSRHPRAVPAATGSGSGTRARMPIWRSRTAWGVMMIFGANSLSSYALFAWLPTRLTDAGISEATAGVLLAVFGGMGVPAALTVPHLAARGSHTVLLVGQFVAAFAVGELGLLLAPLHLTLLWVVLAGWGSGGFPLALALIGLRTRTPTGAGTLSGFVQGLGYFVAGFGPITVGVLRETTGGWTAPFAVLIAVLAVMLLGGVLAARPGAVEDELIEVAR
jgi:CP family cyanate transporter-like MFS transporter